jgi:hypothetical protein
VKADNESTGQRWCVFCKMGTQMNIRVEEFAVILTCPKCTKVRELDRF